jgi:hypothetical protein
MNKLLNLKNLLFDVDYSDYVFLCYGPLRVAVCHLDNFDDFADDLVCKIENIRKEVRENY